MVYFFTGIPHFLHIPFLCFSTIFSHSLLISSKVSIFIFVSYACFIYLFLLVRLSIVFYSWGFSILLLFQFQFTSIFLYWILFSILVFLSFPQLFMCFLGYSSGVFLSLNSLNCFFICVVFKFLKVFDEVYDYSSKFCVLGFTCTIFIGKHFIAKAGLPVLILAWSSMMLVFF